MNFIAVVPLNKDSTLTRIDIIPIGLLDWVPRDTNQISKDFEATGLLDQVFTDHNSTKNCIQYVVQERQKTITYIQAV